MTRSLCGQTFSLSGIQIRVPMNILHELPPDWQSKTKFIWQDSLARFAVSICEDHFYQPVEEETAYFLKTFEFQLLCDEKSVHRAGLHGRRICFLDDDGGETMQEFFSYEEMIGGVNGFIITMRMSPGFALSDAMYNRNARALLKGIRRMD